MSELPEYAREVRDTVIRSGLTGVAVTVLAATAFSPAGFGGIIGTSVASGLGLDHTARASEDPYSRLPPFPSPLSQTELTDIRGELASTAASLEITRAATEGKIEYVRTIAEHQGLSAPMAVLHRASPIATTALAAPAARFASATAATPLANVEPVAASVHTDGNAQLAALLLAHERL
ncbi:MAG: hypothetical protein HY054_11860 [Proteobacteria bacterium]|nr:hypothetical protein [Pseudomonadota bacterium]